MSREVVAVDVDEVMFPFVSEFIKFDKQCNGSALSVEDFFCYRFEEVMNLPTSEAMERVYSFNGADHSGILPLASSDPAVAELGSQYDLVAVTARHPRFRPGTHTWLNRHFPETFKEIVHIGYEPVMEKPRTKAEVCQELGAVALIDDSISHVSGCVEVGVSGVLFGSYPWNQADELPAGVTRCEDWAAVLEYFDGLD